MQSTRPEAAFTPATPARAQVGSLGPWTRALAALVTLSLGAAGASPPQASGAQVDTSESCALCHSGADGAQAMRDSQGHGIAPVDLWRSTMMANAARDPLWRAVVSAEIAAAPEHAREIEETCLRCHSPLAERAGLEDHGTGSFLHLLECEGKIAELALDGVSCTICHGISERGLGTPASFSAGFRLDEQGRLFGPHEQPFAMPMRRHSGFTPAHGEHITESRLCGSCHTLETHALGAQDAAPFLEQSPYLEWRNSAFDEERAEPGPLAMSCQDCHVPTYDEHGEAIATRIARNPGGRDFPPVRERQPYGRHLFVGGNTLVLQMFRDHGEELRVAAPPEAFEATLRATRDQLRQRSARLQVLAPSWRDGRLTFEVEVSNLTGHKLPTGHPTRRAWLRVVVRDAAGEVLFASGEHDDQGRLLGGDGQPLASELRGGPVEAHRARVETAEQVALYEGQMADGRGEPTWTLLQGRSWLRDTRLLPRGWSPEHPDAPRTRPVGTGADPDFVGGGDRVSFSLELSGAQPLVIEAELLYQTLGARWAAELLAVETPEVERFRRLYEGADRRPELLAESRAEVPPR